MKGYRTLAVNAGMAGGAAILHYLAGVDLNQYVGPTGALIGAGVINLALRFLTTTPVGQK